MTLSIGAWPQGASFTPAELDNLFAPVALYPDPLLAQILPAATYPDQIQAAGRFGGGSAAVDNQPWDVSVRAVAHYPDVTRMMAESPDWTIAIGQAYVNQADDVMRSIQRLRAKARLQGYLNSNSQQTVSVSNGYISIVPAQAQYIYVPTYNPQVVYTERRPSWGQTAVTFGLGLLIGSWLNNNINWNNRRVYYHGWSGPGWVARSRPWIRTSPRYVNRAWANRPVPVNRNIRSRDISGYRRDVQRSKNTYVTPGVVTPGRPGPAARPGVPPGRPGREPMARPTPRPLPVPGPPVPVPRPVPKPGVTAPPPTPGAGPTVPTARPGARPGQRPGTGVVTPAPVPRPGAPAVRPGTTPGARPGADVTTPTPTRRRGPAVTAPAPSSKSGTTVRPGGKPSAGGSRRAPAPKKEKPKAQPSEGRSRRGR